MAYTYIQHVSTDFDLAAAVVAYMEMRGDNPGFVTKAKPISARLTTAMSGVDGEDFGRSTEDRQARLQSAYDELSTLADTCKDTFDLDARPPFRIFNDNRFELVVEPPGLGRGISAQRRTGRGPSATRGCGDWRAVVVCDRIAAERAVRRLQVAHPHDASAAAPCVLPGIMLETRVSRHRQHRRFVGENERGFATVRRRQYRAGCLLPADFRLGAADWRTREDSNLADFS